MATLRWKSLSYFWRSTDDGKTFAFITDTANFCANLRCQIIKTFGNVITGAFVRHQRAPRCRGISGAPYGASTAPWGEMYIGKEFLQLALVRRRADMGVDRSVVLYQPMRETVTGFPWYPNACMSFRDVRQGRRRGLYDRRRCHAQFVSSEQLRQQQLSEVLFAFCQRGRLFMRPTATSTRSRVRTWRRAIHCRRARAWAWLRPNRATRFGSIIWNTLPAGNPLKSQSHRICEMGLRYEIVEHHFAPPPGTPPHSHRQLHVRAELRRWGSLFRRQRTDVSMGRLLLGANLRPSVTLNPVPGKLSADGCGRSGHAYRVDKRPEVHLPFPTITRRFGNLNLFVVVPRTRARDVSTTR